MSKTFIIPKGELADADRKAFREAAIAALLRRTAEKLGGGVDEYDVRGLENLRDVLTVLDQWNTAALALVGTVYSVFQAVPAPVTTASQLIVFYKVGVETAPMPVSLLTFRTGGVVGNIIGEFDLEQIVNGLETEGYFNRPIVIDPNTTYAVQVTCRIATGAPGRVQLGAYICEPKGNTIAS